MDYQQSFRILIPSCSSEKKGWHTTMEHYRKLNAQTIPHRHPLPRIQTIIDSLGKNQYLSLLDQTKVYRQLHMDPESRKFTAFLTSFLTSPPILAFPDFQLPVILHTDASVKGLGCALYQIQKNQLHVLSWLQKTNITVPNSSF